jgi:hypothetical protein
MVDLYVGSVGTPVTSEDCRWRPGKVTDIRDWRNDCAAGGRASVKRETPAPTQSSLLPGENRRLQACIAALEKAKQGAEGKIGRIGDFPENEDQGHHCHIGFQEQQSEH